MPIFQKKYRKDIGIKKISSQTKKNTGRLFGTTGCEVKEVL
jgi:hypothetical protein